MSAGTFLLTRYQSTYLATNIHPIRVQPETTELSLATQISVINSPPGGVANNPISAVGSRGRRQRGLIPRSARLRLIDNTVPDNYSLNSVTVIPILTEGFYDQLTIGIEVLYLGSTWQVIGLLPERVA